MCVKHKTGCPCPPLPIHSNPRSPPTHTSVFSSSQTKPQMTWPRLPRPLSLIMWMGGIKKREIARHWYEFTILYTTGWHWAEDCQPAWPEDRQTLYSCRKKPQNLWGRPNGWKQESCLENLQGRPRSMLHQVLQASPCAYRLTVESECFTGKKQTNKKRILHRLICSQYKPMDLSNSE